MSDKLLLAIDNLDINYIRENIKDELNNGTNIKKIIIQVLGTYNRIKNTDQFDNCIMLNDIISYFNELDPKLLSILFQQISINDNSILEYIYNNNLFFNECDLITIFSNNNIKLRENNHYLSNVFTSYNNCSNTIYYLINSCKLIGKTNNAECVINNLIHMFKLINKDDYNKYKIIYMSFEDYDKFYLINRHHIHIKYFIIQILFFTMIENINFNSMYKLMKTIIYNKELLSYLRLILKKYPDKTDKYRNINNVSKSSIFINSEHQILLNEMLDIIFNFDNSTIDVFNISNKKYKKKNKNKNKKYKSNLLSIQE